ncbi:MAG: thermonuclease family protein [Sulfitobacter sp.]
MKSIALATLFICCALITGAAAETRLVDGDTLTIDDITFRINGIDAPEFGQKCNKSSGTRQCGKEALAELDRFTSGKAIRCEPIAQDEYGRTIATCFAGGEDIGAHMVRSGMAWAFVRFSRKYVDEEAQARQKRIGVWQSATQTAWDYRAARWEVAEQESPEGCPIKGNISKNGRIYHAPWSPWYTRTKVSVNKGERWFCSEAEALEAGWRAPYWGQ